MNDFKKLGQLTEFCRYIYGIGFVLTILTATVGIGLIVWIILYKLGFKITSLGGSYYKFYGEYLNNDTTNNIRQKWKQSLFITSLLFIFFAFLLIGFASREDILTDGIPVLIFFFILTLSLIPQFILLSKTKSIIFNKK